MNLNSIYKRLRKFDYFAPTEFGIRLEPKREHFCFDGDHKN